MFKMDKERFLAFLLVFFVPLGVAQADDVPLNFTCPQVYYEGGCPENFKPFKFDDEWVCIYDGKFTYFEEDVNEKGEVIQFKDSQGTCSNGMPNGPATSWKEDKHGRPLVITGNYENGLLQGPVLYKLDGLVTQISCFETTKRYEITDYGNREWFLHQQLLWGYHHEFPVEPKLSEVDKELRAQWKSEIKALRKENQFLSKKLSGLAKFCPVATDDFCQQQPISKKRFKVPSIRKKGEEPKYVTLRGKDPFQRKILNISPDICQNGFAVQTDRSKSSVRAELETVKTSQGLTSVNCLDKYWHPDSDENPLLWGVGVGYPPPPALAIPKKPEEMVLIDGYPIFQQPGYDKNSGDPAEKSQQELFLAEVKNIKRFNTNRKSWVKSFKKNSAKLKKIVGECEKPTDKICSYLNSLPPNPELNESEEDIEKYSSPLYRSEHFFSCVDDYLVKVGGRTKVIDDEVEALGFNWARIKPGHIYGSCNALSYDEYGEFMENVSVWEVQNKYPGAEPVPPTKKKIKNDVFMQIKDGKGNLNWEKLDPERFDKALEEHKNALSAHKKSIEDFKLRSDSIEKLGKICPTVNSSYCMATGVCAEQGKCRWNAMEQQCIVGKAAHCKQSLACKEDGKCNFSEGRCVGKNMKDAPKDTAQDPRSKYGSARIGGTPIILGPVVKSHIDAVIKRNQRRIAYCYQRERTKNPTLGGKIVVKFVIDKTGAVSKAGIKKSSMGSKAVEDCVSNVFRTFKFPKPNGGGITIVSYPFIFR